MNQPKNVTTERARAAKAARIEARRVRIAARNSRNRKVLAGFTLAAFSPLAFAGFHIVNSDKGDSVPLQLASASPRFVSADTPTIKSSDSQHLQEVLSDNARLRTELNRLATELAQVRLQLAAALDETNEISDAIVVANKRLDHIHDSATKLAVNFKFGNSNFSPDADLAEQLAKYAQAAEKINVSGYTDSLGPLEANKVVAMKRAIAAKQHLIEQGISEAKISVYANPGVYVATNDTPEGRAANRRVEMEFIGAGSAKQNTATEVASK